MKISSRGQKKLSRVRRCMQQRILPVGLLAVFLVGAVVVWGQTVQAEGLRDEQTTEVFAISEFQEKPPKAEEIQEGDDWREHRPNDDHYWDGGGCANDWGWYRLPTEQEIERARNQIFIQGIPDFPPENIINVSEPIKIHEKDYKPGQNCSETPWRISKAFVIVETNRHISRGCKQDPLCNSGVVTALLRPVRDCQNRSWDEKTWAFVTVGGFPKSIYTSLDDYVAETLDNIRADGRLGFAPSCHTEVKPADTVPQPPKPADNEPDTGYQRPPSSDPGSGSSGGGGAGWVVVVGGLAVMGAAAAGFTGLAAAAAVLVRRAKKKRLEQGDQTALEDDDIVGYILQLSEDELMLKPNQVQSVAIDCWQVTADGSYKAAPEASIQIQPPPVSSGINVWPLSGQGSLDVHIQLDGLPLDYRYHVVVYASGGGHSTSAAITLMVDPGLVLSLTTPEDRRTLEPGEEEGLWACASLEPDPPDPNFDSDLENAKIIFEVKGPNADWVDAGQIGENAHGKWVYLLARAPSPGAKLTPGNPTLLAKYQLGNTWLVEELKLELQAEYELKLELFDVPKTSDITYNAKAGEWQASALLVYWVNANEGKTPVDPGFEYGFPDPPVLVDPPALHVKSSDGFEVHAEHQYLLKFEVDQDLEPYFGEELTENDGMVRLAVEAIDSEGQSYTAEMDYQLRPDAIQMIYYWEDSPEERLEEEREHNGILLKPGELLAYEKDEIGVGAFLVRADQAEDFYTAYDQRLQLRGEPQAELRGEKSWEYLLKPEEEGEGLNRYAARIQAKEIELYAVKEEPFEVRVALSLDESRYPNYYKPYPSQTEIKIDPLHIFLKLWVFPGTQTGTSLAGALMYLPSKRVGLRDFELTMDIQSKGSRLTADQAVQKTDGEGLARWALSYHGLNWNNYRSSLFTVRCGVPKPKGGFKGTQVQIDIGKNVDTFVADVYQQRNSAALNLENPDITSFMAGFLDFHWPDFFYGPLNNVVSLVSDYHKTYVCGNLADRIIKWWDARRTGKNINNFDEKRITSMNGIDMAQYIMGMLPEIPHTFAGIFLANADKTPTDDPRFIDPWWIQNWSHPVRRRVNGLYTKANQYTMLAGLYAGLTLLALLIGKFLAWKFGLAFTSYIRKRVMALLFGSGLAWAGSQGITVWPDGHIKGKNYIKPAISEIDYSFDSIPNAISSLKQKGIPAVKPIVEW